MSREKFLLAIFAMAGVMIAVKIIPLLFCKKKIKNVFLKSFLEYIPYAVLTSMIFPEVFHSTGSVVSASVAVVFALVLSYFGQSLVVVALSSTLVAFIVEQVAGLVK